MKKSKIKMISVTFILLYVCYILVSQQITIMNKKAQLEDSKLELERVTNENLKLKDEKGMSETDRYMEKLSRERLGFIKQGENVIVEKKK
ncbi:cell division protein FtsL [Clostridium homopropionicum DSM 5847]|uniref:Cell division protein FtsL n=1 Tax=Clostridium homopropionicum DSM 5847 TaxID=1121318 RepID=A0A0L6Z731_9CLOT|nr:septum formation initiator family protein [Clostridium homopropionicum]KOA18771.1 cell division protein FtsL [Clostridium homopropionicum DSM 5847]SFG77681.1 Septum formation initiator [Clostridium homopropionicum]